MTVLLMVTTTNIQTFSSMRRVKFQSWICTCSSRCC